MSDRARQVLEAQIRRYGRAANAARGVSRILLPLLPGDDNLDGAPVFTSLADAQAWYLDNADGIRKSMIRASLADADEHSSRVVRGLEQVMTSIHDIDGRLELAELALTSARGRNDNPAEAHALMNRGGGYKMGEQPVKAVADYKKAAHLFAKLNDNAGMIAALSRLAVAQAAARQLDDADDTLDQVLALCGDGEDTLAALAYVNRARVSIERGQFDKAIDHGLVGLERLQACDAAQPWFTDAHLELTEAYTAAGEFERASHHLSAVVALLANGSENVPQCIAAAFVGGELLLAQGHPRDALASFQRAVALQSAGPHPYRIANALDGVGKAWFALGDFEQAAQHHTSALSVRIRAGEPFASARTRYHLAMANVEAGQVDEAVRLRDLALLELAGIVDPAADALRAELNRAV
ncbi:tetratricopeptide repeat protein [Catenulispora sp. NF23]|uniref:Tetratricopeptide repeat protein n=1 Tax=Catenulispora pinistramenti TaxID=2705254 RepID=A0ABS5KID5_9ACTN|nr:tetratricopeptide repeat protein [Catenulispora pinistramenti]MBS2531598.1 tetratricopeptide repeat protein [Catenulispora pinistramenti]MBS2546152.1 tetratricopeptide repeat protein [Catenulispora pinistramenti]